MSDAARTRLIDLGVAVRIAEADLAQIARRVADVPLPPADDLTAWALSALLHGWYASLERVLERIARDLGSPPTEGPGWHRHLLRSMTLARAGVRPAVFDAELATRLDRLLAFRHVVRNVYVLDLDPAQVADVVRVLGDVDGRTRAALTTFANWLDGTASELT